MLNTLELKQFPTTVQVAPSQKSAEKTFLKKELFPLPFSWATLWTVSVVLRLSKLSYKILTDPKRRRKIDRHSMIADPCEAVKSAATANDKRETINRKRQTANDNSGWRLGRSAWEGLLRTVVKW